ncbi:Clan CA, family C40, NlpC/P60 superfamily cysteine peptidase [Trichomonas vaginalis G3]|uniref:Clan CA, family C40, NlpC/P60 superfamily cysteine peptidase n=1 Tax=Trichomonas vaginalis (strain ATCC PRA-98 / G3) TaxID=412133 RepID=A2DYF6_TRIV3|nr:Clan CA, family C40, NlpC/P60 superfamily cysteine peptidase [Trichomonas vaginalis G3]|eukprot:XP_001326856.1 Clan CA, family C40, NlpC/P60 superfamily cysteine peptidase [Trichomonas vaginalis G3]
MIFAIFLALASCGRHRHHTHRFADVAPKSNGRGEDIFNIARSKLGCPYVYGAAGPNSFDCSGLTYYCHQQVGISIPRVASAQQAGGVATNGMCGDICCFGNPAYHVGLCDGVGNYIHAPQSGDVVRYSNYWNGVVNFKRYW